MCKEYNIALVVKYFSQAAPAPPTASMLAGRGSARHRLARDGADNSEIGGILEELGEVMEELGDIVEELRDVMEALSSRFCNMIPRSEFLLSKDSRIRLSHVALME